MKGVWFLFCGGPIRCVTRFLRGKSLKGQAEGLSVVRTMYQVCCFCRTVLLRMIDLDVGLAGGGGMHAWRLLSVCVCPRFLVGVYVYDVHLCVGVCQKDYYYYFGEC